MGEEIHLRNAIANLDELILSLGQRILTYFASRSADFTIKEMFLIDVLGSRKSQTMSELAQILSVPLTTMTSMVTRLVKRGYLERSRTEEDRRIVLVSLSEKGREIFQQHRYEYIRTVSEVLEDLTEEEQRTMLAFMGQVLTTMSSGHPLGSGGAEGADAGNSVAGPDDCDCVHVNQGNMNRGNAGHGVAGPDDCDCVHVNQGNMNRGNAGHGVAGPDDCKSGRCRPC